MTVQTLIFDRDKGGRFIDWTVYFISNQKTYLDCTIGQQVPVVDNPLNKTNSHGHKGNHAGRLSELEKFYLNKNCSVLFHQMRNNDRSFSDDDSATWKSIELAKNMSDQIVVLQNHKKFILYDFSISRRSNNIYSLDGNRILQSESDMLDDFVNKFFANSKKTWQDLNEVWDKREFVALNFKPFNNRSIEDYHNFDFDKLVINTEQVWSKLDVYRLFDYLALKIHNKKLEDWQNIYKQWLQLHQQRINFCLLFETIINNILDNVDMDLEVLQLDILQEAAIQHTLIYHYNLNFKTWQLEKFKNTKQLHNLLEQNFHTIA
jgi:hypothetical protein